AGTREPAGAPCPGPGSLVPMPLAGRQVVRPCRASAPPSDPRQPPLPPRPPTRRQALTLGGLSLLSLAVPGLSLRAEPAGKYRTLLWISPDGGESQIDSFDPKPNCPTEVRGPFGTIPTALPGVRVSELYPRTARLLDQVALLRARHVADLDHLLAMR